MNIVCSVGVWNRYRRIVRESPALIVRGMLERSVEGVTNVVADGFTAHDCIVWWRDGNQMTPTASRLYR